MRNLCRMNAVLWGRGGRRGEGLSENRLHGAIYGMCVKASCEHGSERYYNFKTEHIYSNTRQGAVHTSDGSDGSVVGIVAESEERSGLI